MALRLSRHRGDGAGGQSSEPRRGAVGKQVGEHHDRVGNQVEGLEQGEVHRRTSTMAAGIGRTSLAVRVSTGGRRRGSRGRRGVRGRGKALGGYVGPGGRAEKTAMRRRSQRRGKSMVASGFVATPDSGQHDERGGDHQCGVQLQCGKAQRKLRLRSAVTCSGNGGGMLGLDAGWRRRSDGLN
jgi:hypothetical protein